MAAAHPSSVATLPRMNKAQIMLCSPFEKIAYIFLLAFQEHSVYEKET